MRGAEPIGQTGGAPPSAAPPSTAPPSTAPDVDAAELSSLATHLQDLAERERSELARNLDARIRLLVMQNVPLSWSVECPPVSLVFIEERCRQMALECAEAFEVKIDVYLCWDKWQALRQALRPRSLIVIGGKRRLWRSDEQKLARRLESEGHRIVFADTRCVHAPHATEEKPK